MMIELVVNEFILGTNALQKIKVSYTRKIILLRYSKTQQILACLLLLLLCAGFYVLFQHITTCYFTGEGELHIIDVHVKNCGYKGLFDGPYIAKAAPFYMVEKYKHSFLVIDTIFPIVYSAFFLTLGYAFYSRKWYRFFILFIIAGALFDYAEDYSFLYYLYHPSSALADKIAFCTSIKSILLPLNGLGGLFFFVKGLQLKNWPVKPQP